MRVVFAIVALCSSLFSQGIGGKGGLGGKAGIGGALGASPVTWTLIQHPHNFTCSAGGSSVSCTVTSSSTTAGNLGILLSATDTNGTSATYSSASGGGTWTHCPASASALSSAGGATDCAYILSLTGGSTSETFTWAYVGSTGSNVIDVEFLEVHRSTGTATYDSGNATTSGSCSSCVAPSITLSGSDDYIAQWIAYDENIASISGSYSNPFDFENTDVSGGFAGALNQSSGTGPTWGTTGGPAAAAMSGVAFK